jgi:ankyrin repeat protein
MNVINVTNLSKIVLIGLLVVYISFNANGQPKVSVTQSLCQEVIQVPANFTKIQDLLSQGADIDCRCDAIQRTFFIEMDRIMISFFSTAISEIDLKANTNENYLIERVSVSPLQIALSREDFPFMRFLLDNGVDPNKSCCDNMLPLEYAFHHNKKELVNFLIENGANPKIIQLGCPFDVEITKYMIAKGANPNTIKIDCALWDKERALALLELRPDLSTSSIADFDFNELLHKPKLLKFLIENGFSYDGVNNSAEKKTMLHLAAEHNKMEVVDLMINYKPLIDSKDAKGMTPLCYGVQANNYEIVKLLFNEGASVNVALEKEATYSSPLAIAVHQSNLELTRFLLESGANSELSKEDLLAFAVKNDNRKIVAQLVRYGANPNRLIELYGKDNLFKNSDLFEFVLSLGALSQEESNVFTLKAVQEGEEEAVGILTKYKTGLNSVDTDGKSPLHYAFIQSNFTMAYQLIEAGANVNQEIKGYSPFLHRAVMTKNFVMANKLLQNGADVNIKDEYGKTALAIAINDKEYELAKLLLKYSISITCDDLFRAIDLEHLSMVKLLVENKADLNCKKDKLTPLAFAKKYNLSHHVADYLQEM